MPPAVAQNASRPSASASGATWMGPWAGVSSVSSVTCDANEPSRWWFLPWMSAATAPPTVTWRVPGVTGGNHPSGTRSHIS
jgi:hypothetical protein